MAKGFNPDEYVDVAQRIQEFYANYPDGRLATDEMETRQLGEQWFVMVTAEAYRTPDDPHPGVGMAWEPVPGRTSFTKDSELMNAETSAWGRAIASLGFATKHIASANEVANRQSNGNVDMRVLSQTLKDMDVQPKEFIAGVLGVNADDLETIGKAQQLIGTWATENGIEHPAQELIERASKATDTYTSIPDKFN